MDVGIDEAGRGPVIGPLVIAAVAIEDQSDLVKLEVKDSKKLTRTRREELYDRVREIAASVEVTVLTAEDIDSMREDRTMNEIEADEFSRLMKALPADRYFIDCVDVNEERCRAFLLERAEGEPLMIVEHGADDMYPVVSAASIIAKVDRDRAVDRISKELGGRIGSGYPSDPVTIAFLKGWIEERGSPPPYTRRSWKTVQRLLAESSQSSLDRF